MTSRKERVEQIIRAEEDVLSKKLSYLKDFYPNVHDTSEIDWKKELKKVETYIDSLGLSHKEVEEHSIKVPSECNEYSDEMML